MQQKDTAQGCNAGTCTFLNLSYLPLSGDTFRKIRIKRLRRSILFSSVRACMFKCIYFMYPAYSVLRCVCVPTCWAYYYYCTHIYYLSVWWWRWRRSVVQGGKLVHRTKTHTPGRRRSSRVCVCVAAVSPHYVPSYRRRPVVTQNRRPPQYATTAVATAITRR